MLADLEHLVSIESPSHDVEAITRSAMAVATSSSAGSATRRADRHRRRPARARPVRAVVEGADRRPPRHRLPDRARWRPRPFAVAGGTGHRSRGVRHEGGASCRPIHALVAARRSRRGRAAVHRRRGGRLEGVTGADRGARRRLRRRAGDGAERRRRSAEDGPQGHRHVRGRRARPGRPRRPRTGEGHQLARRRGAADHQDRDVRRSREGHDRHADGRDRGHRRQRRARADARCGSTPASTWQGRRNASST